MLALLIGAVLSVGTTAHTSQVRANATAAQVYVWCGSW